MRHRFLAMIILLLDTFPIVRNIHRIIVIYINHILLVLNSPIVSIAKRIVNARFVRIFMF